MSDPGIFDVGGRAQSGFDRLSELRDIVTGDVTHAQEAILNLEVFSSRRGGEATYKLRDVLDCLAAALDPSISDDLARVHFADCRAQLAILAVQPYNWLAQKKFCQASRLARTGCWVFRVLLLKKPKTLPTGTDLRSELRVIDGLIIAGGTSRVCGVALPQLQQAIDRADALLDILDARRFYERTYNLFLVGLGLIVPVLLGIFF